MTVSTRARLIVALVVVLCVIGILIRTAVIHAASFYMTVPELYAEGSAAVGQQTTVSGSIVGSSVHYNPAAELLRFRVRDGSAGRSLAVTFHGEEPDDFANNWPVIVTGTLTVQRAFQASQLLIKCPSKYTAQPQTKTFTSAS